MVIGAGIAGSSAAYWLSEHPSSAKVILLEAERTVDRHTTGRSAAVYIRNLGSGPARPLTLASYEFLANPNPAISEQTFLHQRGLLSVARSDQLEDFEAHLLAGQQVDSAISEITPNEALKLFPALKPGSFQRALYEPGAADIDVAGLHQAYLRGLRNNGGCLELANRVDAASADGQGWRVDTVNGVIGCDIVVNAAGSWGDLVATRAGIAPIGLIPKRRTVFMVKSQTPGSQAWPMLVNICHDFYLKPEVAQFLCSPANEDPMEPCDVKPEELDVALGISRINEATTLEIVSIQSSWAGLRTFSPDESLVLGPETYKPNFIWCVGQGGVGIQTSPAAGQFLADQVLGEHFSLGMGVDRAALSVDRYRRPGQ